MRYRRKTTLTHDAAAREDCRLAAEHVRVQLKLLQHMRTAWLAAHRHPVGAAAVPTACLL